MPANRSFILITAAGILSVPAWPQAMIEYGLSVGRAGVAGVNTKGVFDKAGAALGKAADVKAAGAPTARQQEVTRNRETLAAQAGESGASVEVAAPEGTVVSVDQRVVGYGRTSVKLAPGKHKVRVAGPGWVNWEEEVEVAEKEIRSVSARLERAASTVNVIQIHPAKSASDSRSSRP